MAQESDVGPPYWPFYCEENIWHLCADPRLEGDQRWAVLISNPGRQVALWFQKAAPRRGLPVVWDYHVVLLVQNAGGWQIWDLDSALPTPLDAERWLAATFAGTTAVGPDFAPRFRLLEADLYRRSLASDRRHMRHADGSWHAPPPPWPPIGEGSNLMELLDMDRSSPGEVVGLDELDERLALPPGIPSW